MYKALKHGASTPAQGVRTPFIIRAPGLQPAGGARTAHLAEAVDMYRTLADAMGLLAARVVSVHTAQTTTRNIDTFAYGYITPSCVYTHAKNATAAWNLPILSTRILGQNNHAKRRDHGISPGFPVHYQDLGH